MGRTTRLHQATPPQRAARARAMNPTHPAPGATAACSPLVALQQSIGNRAVGRLVQAKLRVGRPGDRFEQEADRVADQVMRMPAGAAPAAIAAPRISRKCAECEKEEKLQTKPAGSGPTAEAPASVYEVLHLPGQPLDSAPRAFMEPRFGRDFNQVRVHTGRDAAESSRFMNAVAYTVGRDIVFGRGQYAPHTEPGRRLIAHELAHVVQQHAMGPATNGPGVVLQREVVDPRALHTETVSSPRHVRISEWLVEPMAGGGTSRTELYWVDFEVDAKGVMRASVRTVTPDRAYRSATLRFGDQFRAALQHFSAKGVQVNTFEGDWSYMTKDERSENLRVFREGMEAGKTREQAARETPSGRVARRSGFELTSVENVPESQEHLAEEGVRRWRVKAVFRRIPAPPKPPAGGTPTPPTRQGAPGGGSPPAGSSKSVTPPTPAQAVSPPSSASTTVATPKTSTLSVSAAKSAPPKVTFTPGTSRAGPTPEIARGAFEVALPARAQVRTTVAAAGAQALLASLLSSVRGAEAAKAQNRLEQLLREAEPLRWRGNAVVLRIVAEVPNNVDPFAKVAGVGDPGQVVYFKSMDIVGVFPRRRSLSNQPTMSPNLAPRDPRRKDPDEWTLSQQIEAQMGEKYPVKEERPRPGFHYESRELHLAPFDSPEVRMVVGARVPATARTYPVPAWIAAEFPSLRTYSYVVAEGKMGFVDPNTNQIKFIVDLYSSRRP